jgi:hypothetical protein
MYLICRFGSIKQQDWRSTSGALGMVSRTLALIVGTSGEAQTTAQTP